MTKARRTPSTSTEERWGALRNLIADKKNRISDVPAGKETLRTKRLADEHFKNLRAD